jgi:carbamate kinase
MTGYGTDAAEPIHAVTLQQMREIAAAGHFASGSMGPKVAAAMQFVEHGGQRAVVTSLQHIETAISGTFGTVIQGHADRRQNSEKNNEG